MKRDLPALTFGARPGVRGDVSTEALRRWNPDLQAAATPDNPTISIMDPIGADMWGDGVTSKRIAGALRAIGEQPVTVTINSPGGDVFEGAAIYELLRQHSRERGPVTVQIMGLAASAASLIAMAGDEIEIGASSFVMIHNAWVMAVGDRNALAEVAEWMAPFDEAMAAVYAARTGLEAKRIAAMMDRETWLTAAAAIEEGFADRTLDAAAVAQGASAESRGASLRAEKKFDLVAARAGITRDDAREILRALKGGQPGAPLTGQPAAAVQADLQEILNTLKANGA